MCTCVQLWCAAGVDLTGWRVSSQETSEKAPACSTDPLHAEEDGADKKKNHTSPEKRKVITARFQNRHSCWLTQNTIG